VNFHFFISYKFEIVYFNLPHRALVFILLKETIKGVLISGMTTIF